MPERTTVAIIGAGPAGLLLGHILRQAAIDFVILEQRSREYCLSRVRAGVLEQSSVDLIRSLGLDAGLNGHGMVHDGIYLQFAGERHHVDFRELVGGTVTVYGQQSLVRDMIEAHEAIGSALHFDAADVRPAGTSTGSPRVHYRHDGELHELECDLVVGADGYHGVCRQSIPGERISAVEREYPFAWLGILADVAPSTDELIYDLHPDGFAMHSMRSPEVSRLYLQVDPSESIDDWSDERIWAELQNRMGLTGWTLHEGPITDKSITPMRSFVVSTLAVDRLFLVGDAGHIVPPTGAKGLNSAIADVGMLGRAIRDWTAGDDAGLARYSDRALGRQWKIQQFSQWMTDMLHVHRDEADPGVAAFRYRSQLGQLAYTTGSQNALRSLAEQYVGLPIEEA
ncbi:MAG TPA: 4-hydroxybenzoate 3-monooxygenase [Pseudolysinimonas sp.]|nr:4-hydroxybenzoate 3-monooxygenase [Pseudolysinimonas sp.]